MVVAGSVARLKWAPLVAALAGGCIHGAPRGASVRPSSPAEVADTQAAPPKVHVVEPGETLWHIAHENGVTVEELARTNALSDPKQVEVGTRLLIPARGDEARGRFEPHPPRHASVAQLPRAGARPLDSAARGEALAWPTRGVLISPFGARERDQHEGIDLAAPEGADVRAAADGVVLFAGEQRGYGNLVLVGHDRDLVTVYAHNERNLVEKGERVDRGQLIARVGRTGNATGPHLHFEVRVGTRPRDPLGFLR